MLFHKQNVMSVILRRGYFNSSTHLWFNVSSTHLWFNVRALSKGVCPIVCGLRIIVYIGSTTRIVRIQENTFKEIYFIPSMCFKLKYVRVSLQNSCIIQTYSEIYWKRSM